MPDHAALPLPPRLNLATLPALGRAWPAAASVVTLDFAPQAFVYPSGTVGLACLVDAALRRGQEVRVAPGAAANASYWERMGFFDLFDLPGRPARGGRNPADGRFCEVCRADDLHGVEALTERMVEVVQPVGEARAIYSHVISEALNNVCQHSEAVGYCAAQLYAKEGIVRFCIADLGRGLRASLSRHSPRDDAHAVELAMRVGVSGPNPATARLQPHAFRNRGIGLSVARRLVEENGGTLHLWSGVGAYPEPRPDDERGRTIAWRGTLLAAKMPRQQFVRRSVDIFREVLADLGRTPPQRVTRPRRLP